MPIKTVQSSGLTAQSIIQNSTHGVNSTYTSGIDLESTSALTHQQLDENFKSIWPVGSVYINVSSNVNPRDLIGYGYWMSLGRQTILVGKNANLANDVVNYEVDSTAGLIVGEILEAAAQPTGSGSRNKVHEILSSTELTLEGPVYAGDSYPNNEPLTGQQSGVTVTVTGSSGSVQTTRQGLSSTLSAISVVQDINARKCELLITTDGFHNFAKGQRVTLNGIAGNSGQVEPNSEREIISIDSNLKFRVDYRSPTAGNPNAFVLGKDEALSVLSGASATLFGTRYNESVRAGAEQIPFAGTGGTIGQKMDVGEFPAHNHSINWGFVNTINFSEAARRGASAAGSIGSGNGVFRDGQWGFVDTTRRGKYGGTGLQNDVKLTGAFGDQFVVNGVTHQFKSGREAHSNVMPFIAAYFWVRIPDPVFDETNPEDVDGG